MPNVLRNVLLGYGRRSEVRNAIDAINVERQHARLDVEATRRGWILEWFEDAEGHRTGRKEQGRPDWLNLKAQFDRDDVVGVGVESLSRATRSVRDLHNLLHELEIRGLVLISLKEQVDTSSAMGRAFVGFVAIMNQLESDLASERMAANIKFKRETKGRHWGLTPFGCVREGPDLTLVPTKEGAEVDGVWRGYHEALQRCYEWYVEGETGLTRLADRLNSASYRFRDRHGKPRLFGKDDVRRLLDAHRIYAGYVPLGRAKDRPDEIRKGNHQAILPVELCDGVAAMLETRRVLCGNINRKRRPGRVYVLSDILYCAGCGKRLVGYFQDGKQFYRHERAKGNCSSKGQFTAESIESQVLEQMQGFTMPEQMKERIRYLARKMAEEQGRPDWQEARNLLRRLARKLENLKDLRVDGEIDKVEYARRKAEIEVQMRDAQTRMGRAPGDVKDIEDLLSQVDRIAEVIRNGEPKRKKELFNMLFERIEERDAKMTKVVPRAWARPFFVKNGDCGIMALQ